MQEIKVSVIVPIYNTEKFLEKCIDSIVNQTLEEIEIILINDGSTDNSHNICEEYSKKFPQKIRYINNKNIGCSATRNLGISLAKGEYIAFVDSDDYIDKEMYQEMYEKAKKEDLDIIISGVIYENTRKKVVPNIKSNFLEEYLLPKNKIALCWNKLFKRVLIEKNKIKFPESIHYAEDLVFTFQCFTFSRKNGIKKEAYYHYIIHGNNSIFNMKKRMDFIIAFNILYKTLEKNILLDNSQILKGFYKNFNYHLKLSYLLLLNKKVINENEYKKYDKLFYDELKEIKFLPFKSKVLIYYYRSIVWVIRSFGIYDELKKIKNILKRKR